MEKEQFTSIYLINVSNSMIYFRIWLDVGESPLPAQQNAAAGENFFSVSSEILAYTIYYIILFIFSVADVGLIPAVPSKLIMTQWRLPSHYRRRPDNRPSRPNIVSYMGVSFISFHY